jgi:serine/threonine protein kinase
MLRGKPLLEGDSEIDQIFKIFNLFGTPNEMTWSGVSFLPDYKESFPKFKPKDIGLLIPDIENQEKHLLSCMLKLNPKDRYSAYETLKHNVFVNSFDPFIKKENKAFVEIFDSM